LEIASRDRIRKIGRIDIVLERERHPVTPPRSAPTAHGIDKPPRRWSRSSDG
jgi:hypothetical protein